MRALVMVLVVGGCNFQHRVRVPRSTVSLISDRGEVLLIESGRPALIELDCLRIPTARDELSLAFNEESAGLFGGCGDEGSLPSFVARADRDPSWATAELRFRKTTGKQLAAGTLGAVIGGALGGFGAYRALRCSPMEDSEDCDGHDIVAPLASGAFAALLGAVGAYAGTWIARDRYRAE